MSSEASASTGPSQAAGLRGGSPSEARLRAAVQPVPGYCSFGDYLLLGHIAAGGMGVVYQAVHERLNRPCALKLLRSGVFASAAERARFVAEAEAAATLDHPDIVRVRHAGEAEGQLFLEMELVQGGTLADRLAADRSAAVGMPLRQAAALVARLACAVQHAHDRGVLHRDLKPANVLLAEDGAPRLTDFGLARLLDRENDLTRTLAVLGTPAYLAPELAAGRTRGATTAADVYGLGAILYECLAGFPPYAGETPLAVLNAVLAGPPPLPSQRRSDLPRDLEIILLRAMHREAAARMPSAGELAAELERWLTGEPIRSRPVSWWEEVRAWTRRRPAVAGLSVVSVAALLAGLSATTWQWRRAERTAERLLDELTLSDHRRTEQVFDSNEPREAMAHLATSLRRRPADRLAATRLAAALIQRVWPRPVAELGPHEGHVLQAAWSPDGGLILTADAGGHLRAWNGATGAAWPGGEWRHGPAECYWLKWSADGRWFGSELKDGSLRVWRPGAPEPTLRFELPEDRVSLAAFSPAGATLAVVRAEGHAVELWDPATATRLQHWPHPAAVTALDFTHDGRRLATADVAGTARVWDTRTGATLGEPMTAQGALRGVRWHPDGQQLALTLATNAHVELWRWPGCVRIQEYRQDGPTVAAFTPEGLLLRQVRSPPEFVATDLVANTDRYRLEGAHEPALDCVFSEDGRHGVATLDMLNLLPFETASGRLLAEPIRTRWGIESAALSPDGLRLAIAAGMGTATVWALHPPQAVAGGRILPGVTLALAFSPDGDRVWSCDAGGVLRALDLIASDPPAQRHLPRAGLVRAAFSPDLRRVAVVDGRHELEVFEVASGSTAAGPWALPGEAAGLLFSPDGRWLAAGTIGEELVWFDLTNGREAGRVDLRPDASATVYGSRIHHLDFSPDSALLAVATYGGVAAVIEPASGRLRLRLPHPAPVWGVRLSPDGGRIATACGDGIVRVWDSRTGAAAAPPMPHEDQAFDMRFTPDGRQMVSAGADVSLRVWEAATGRQLTRIRTTGPAYETALAFADGWVTAVGDSTALRLWDVATGLPLSERLPLMGGGNRVLIGPGDGWVAGWQNRGPAYLYPVPRPPRGPVPVWLPDVAEATAGLRFGPQGELQIVTPGETIALANRLRGVTGPDPFWASVLRRFVAGEP